MKEQNFDPIVRFFISVIGIVFLAIILMELKFILIPYVLAVFLLFLLEPLHKKLKSKGIPLAVVLLGDLLLFAVLIYGISVFVIGAINQFVNTLPFYESRLSVMLADLTKFLGLKNVDLTKLNLLSILKELHISSFAQDVLS